MPLLIRVAPPAHAIAGVSRRRASQRAGAFAGATLTGLLAALVVAAVVVVCLAAAGVRPRVELSDSMAPQLRAGDVVWLDEIRAADAGVGDVVAFQDPERDRVLVHRVERIAPASLDRLAFVTRGDAGRGRERWKVARTGTIGRYAGLRLPVVGRAVLALRGLPLALFALLSATTLAAVAVRAIWTR